MFLNLIDFLERNKKENFAYVRDHFKGNGLAGSNKEELRDYYYSLGKADICEELLWMIYPLYGRRIIDIAKLELIGSSCRQNENCLDRYLCWLSCEGGHMWLFHRSSRERMIKNELFNNYCFYTIIKDRESQYSAARSTSL